MRMSRSVPCGWNQFLYFVVVLISFHFPTRRRAPRIDATMDCIRETENIVTNAMEPLVHFWSHGWSHTHVLTTWDRTNATHLSWVSSGWESSMIHFGTRLKFAENFLRIHSKNISPCEFLSLKIVENF